ncbi:MAG TPA: DUF2269 family protein [Candidatus Limnocylindrales bacterium]
MPGLVPIFLTIHVLTAIVAFGPTFIFSIIARMAAQEPQHGLFALRLTDRIERMVVIPAALLMPVSGSLLVWSEGINLATTHWLVLAIGLYIVAITFAILIQLRTIDRMIELATGMAAAGPVLAAGPGAALAIASERTLHGPSSPAAEMAALGARARNGGIFLAVMVVVIVSLMAGKPAI